MHTKSVVTKPLHWRGSHRSVHVALKAVATWDPLCWDWQHSGCDLTTRRLWNTCGVAMEDPANEVEGVVRLLVDKPTLLRQAETLKKYFTNDVEFYHLYLNTNCGLRALIAIYQLGQLFLNYSGVDFHNIVYDEVRNSLAVRMTVYIRPWLLLWRTINLELFALLELEDVIVPLSEIDQSGIFWQKGQTVKKVKVQRDYFQRDPLVQFIPVIGQIYNSNTLRLIIGNTQALLFQIFQWVITLLLPPKLWHRWFGLYSFDVAFHGE
nr:uncharacterized protein LOC112277867 isoform X1 [Physcomitrium patens]|eukprot:XP_024366430.1 uncharacterized protein LOC112277867 isoform X1 [Physcomitrella patens]